MIFNMVSGGEQISVGTNSNILTGTFSPSGGNFLKQFLFTVTFTTPGIYCIKYTVFACTTNNQYGVTSFNITSNSNTSYERIGNNSVGVFRVTAPVSGGSVNCRVDLTTQDSASSSDVMTYRLWISAIGPAAVTITEIN